MRGRVPPGLFGAAAGQRVCSPHRRRPGAISPFFWPCSQPGDTIMGHGSVARGPSHTMASPVNRVRAKWFKGGRHYARFGRHGRAFDFARDPAFSWP